jgi:hypothetical protein
MESGFTKITDIGLENGWIYAYADMDSDMNLDVIIGEDSAIKVYLWDQSIYNIFK